MRASPGKETAHAAEKYENGKGRALYAVEPFHYTISSNANFGFEERLHLIPGLEKGLTGLRSVQQLMF